MTYFPVVVQVIPYDDFSVDVYFHDGKIVKYDASQLIEEGKVKNNIFSSLSDINVFKKSCTVLNDTLAWDLSGKRDESDCIDIDPLTLYALPFSEERIAVYGITEKTFIVASE